MRVGAVLTERLRTSDFVGRWGADEFLVLLPDTSADGAERAVEDLRARAETAGPPTVSIGWAYWNGGSGVQLVTLAEQALGEARRAGPNTVQRAGEA
jgi:diguanylate cyclase (GGDEF)-like protein